MPPTDLRRSDGRGLLGAHQDPENNEKRRRRTLIRIGANVFKCFAVHALMTSRAFANLRRCSDDGWRDIVNTREKTRSKEAAVELHLQTEIPTMITYVACLPRKVSAKSDPNQATNKPVHVRGKQIYLGETNFFHSTCRNHLNKADEDRLLA